MRALVGPRVPIVATLDLHANVGAAMVREADVLVAYRTNPHVDMWERGDDCARHLRAMLGGMRPHAAFRKLPLAATPTRNNCGWHKNVLTLHWGQLTGAIL